MSRFVQRIVFFILVAAASLGGSRAWAVDPNPLQNAYWRFEEGSDGARVTPRNSDVVLDSSNNNRLQAFMNTDVDASPTYTSLVPPKPLLSGLPNTLAMDFFPNQDLYANNQKINNGYILPGGGFTVESAFYTYNPARFGGIIAKEGTPGGLTTSGGSGLPTFALKTTADTQHLRVQQYDAAGTLVNVDSLQPLVAQQWYYTAVVNDGSQLSLWLDSGAGYELQGSAPVNGALYQGPPVLSDYNGNLKVDAADYVTWRKTNSGDLSAYNLWRADFGKNKYDWQNNWTLGRAQFNGAPMDWFDGIIDEVRISNTALTPSQFLFAPAPTGSALGSGNVPEPTGILLAALAMAAVSMVRGPRRRR